MARSGSFKLSETVKMQVSSPESGEVAATSRKYPKILIRADGVVPEPIRFKDLFPKRLGFGTTPSAALRS